MASACTFCSCPGWNNTRGEWCTCGHGLSVHRFDAVQPPGFNCPHTSASETPAGTLLLVNHRAAPGATQAYQYKLCALCFARAMLLAAQLHGVDPELADALAKAIATLERFDLGGADG